MPVIFSLTAPVIGSTAYSGALAPVLVPPPRAVQIWSIVTQPPRSPTTAASRYKRPVVAEYRTLTVWLASHSGLGIGMFGEGVSVPLTAVVLPPPGIIIDVGEAVMYSDRWGEGVGLSVVSPESLTLELVAVLVVALEPAAARRAARVARLKAL